MVINDLITVERRLERLALDRQRGKKGDPEEIELLEQAAAILSEERALRTTPGIADHVKLRGFGLLSGKPLIVIANNEDDDPNPPDLGEDVTPVVIRAQIEAELAEIGLEEREEFMAELDITESALDRLLRASYEALDLISFFTVGEDEVRAWTIKRDTPHWRRREPFIPT